MNYLQKAQMWKEFEGLDPIYREQLENMTEKELKEAFTHDLTFGTGGLRGTLGAGTAHINYYVVRKATYGFGKYLETLENAHSRGVVIAHDNRAYSKEFALDTAKVFATMGFKVYLFEDLRPTPELSYAVRHFSAIGGVMITASHNPKEYNGYKIYDEFGCQLVPHLADKVIAEINKIEDYFAIDNTKNHELITYIGAEVDAVYRQAVNTIRINPELKGNFKVVYTPLHGTGQVFAVDVLRENGFDCYPVVSQMTNDPNFSGVRSSNPENPEAFIEAIEYAKEIGASIVLATDPDADRLGMGILHNGEFVLLNGNESATLMVDYICSQLKSRGELPENGWVFSTNVSGSLPLKIAERYGLHTYTSLTGFKFIGEQAHKVKANGGVYLYGYEESYGCLIKDFVRDKDAIQAILMICEIAAWCETQGMDIVDYLDKISDREGYFNESQENIYLRGLEGKEKINKIMETFRHGEVNLKFGEIIKKEDNLLQIAYEYEDNKILTSTIDLPKSDVLKYFLDDESWFVLRPSGTEPKLKVYFSTVGDSKEHAIHKNNKLRAEVMKLIEKI